MPITLMPHNIETYGKVNKDIEKNNKTAVIQPTGTGKMYIGLKYVEDNKGKKTIYIAPSNAILHDVKKNIFAEGMTMQDFPNLKRITYQKLATLSDEEIEKLEADIIIIDEFHHCGAPVWGKGVERLIERNPNAKILGFSATPIRYNDGLRDMADEMFENNVASEMTLEEAIDRGILPGATYVSTLYGYEQELGKMQADIDSMKGSIENRRQSQELLDELRKKLDENTQNLPELLSEHMKNKSGKYIVFCKNIDDMNEKMEQAQKMFGGVNSNIKVRGVSSKIKETDKILTEFEQDNEEGTLKLLYAVDMISEGYHVKDLDGVVMMRPTYSPTVFTQQLGRGLTVGNDKETVILDLVNNFDSCKIIEDLAERMKQYKGREGAGEKEKRKSSRLSIFDTTKEFREIAERITELTKRRTISLEEKIEIFERFAKTEEELVGNTTFEGYPIGQWAIQIRYDINSKNSGKDKKNEQYETQIERLENLGILERQIDSTIDEKIDELIKWKDEHSDIKVAVATDRYIKEYLESNENIAEDEKEELLKRYERMQKYLEYVKARTYVGKLNEGQLDKLKQANFDNKTYGYSDEIEELSVKYRLKPQNIKYLIDKYGSMEEFVNKFKDGTLEEDYSFLKRAISIDNYGNKNEDKLAYAIAGDGLAYAFLGKESESSIIAYSGKGLNEMLETLTDLERRILTDRYGLEDGTSKSLDEVGKERNVTKERIRQVEVKGLRKLRNRMRSKKIFIDLDEEAMDEIYNSNAIFTPDEEYKDIPCNLDFEGVKHGLEKRAKERKKIENRKKQEEWAKLSEKEKQGFIDIEKLDLSVRAYTCLKRAGINNVGDIQKMTKEELQRIRNLGLKTSEEVLTKLESLGIHMREDGEKIEIENSHEIIKATDVEEKENDINSLADKKRKMEYIEQIPSKETKIEELGLSIRAYNCLKRAGINNISDILKIKKEELQRTRNLGFKAFEEILIKLEGHGFVFNQDGELVLGDNEEKTEIKESQEELKTTNKGQRNIENKTPQDLENMSEKELQQLIANNEQIIKENNTDIKKALVERALAQQKTIAEQQLELNRLNNKKYEI